MKQLSFFKTLSALLLLLNLAILGFLFFKPPQKPKSQPPRFKHMVIRELGFDKDQREAYLQLVKDHGQKLRALNEAKKTYVDEYFSLSVADSVSEQAIKHILTIEEDRFKLTRQHFADIKALCNDEQLLRFDEVIHRGKRLLHSNR